MIVSWRVDGIVRSVAMVNGAMVDAMKAFEGFRHDLEGLCLCWEEKRPMEGMRMALLEAGFDEPEWSECDNEKCLKDEKGVHPNPPDGLEGPAVDAWWAAFDKACELMAAMRFLEENKAA